MDGREGRNCSHEEALFCHPKHIIELTFRFPATRRMRTSRLLSCSCAQSYHVLEDRVVLMLRNTL